MKTKARTLSADMNAITSKWDGKGEAPVPEAKMGTLALFVAHTRSIIPFGGPLEGYKNTEDREDEHHE